MPKSKHRKNQKEKSKIRTQRIKSEQNKYQKALQEEFLKEMQSLKDIELGIEEVQKTEG